MATVRVYDGITPEPIVFEGIDLENLSFIDRESHGQANTFGITSRALTLRGTKLVISSPNVVAVAVDA